MFSRRLERTKAFRSLKRLSRAGARDADWPKRLKVTLWRMRLEALGDLRVIEPPETWAAPEKPSGPTRRKLNAYLRLLETLEKQTAELLGPDASALAARTTDALKIFAIGMRAEQAIYLDRIKARRDRLRGTRSKGRGAKLYPSTAQLVELSGLLEWVPTSKRCAILAELHAFATGMPPLPAQQIRYQLKDYQQRHR